MKTERLKDGARNAASKRIQTVISRIVAVGSIAVVWANKPVEGDSTGQKEGEQ